MFGMVREFKCKNCNLEQIHRVGITDIYRINIVEIDYIYLNCKNCGKKNYIPVGVLVLEDTCEIHKEQDYENNRKLLTDKSEFLEEDTLEIEKIRVVAF